MNVLGGRHAKAPATLADDRGCEFGVCRAYLLAMNLMRSTQRLL